ncbi:MAG TPA: hypothetical protein VGM59_01585 [Dongiaceae bacterium]|jgi:hypothetical protein
MSQNISEAAIVTPRRRWQMVLAVFLSFLCPGLGELATGVSTNRARGSAIPVACAMLLIVAARPSLNIGLCLWMLLLWFVSGLTSAAKVYRKAFVGPLSLSAGVAPPAQPKFALAVLHLGYIAAALALVAISFRLFSLTLISVPENSASEMISAGERLVAISLENGDTIRRGQLIEYNAKDGPKLGRVLAVAGDWFTKGPRYFTVNGIRFYMPHDGYIKWDIVDVARALSEPGTSLAWATIGDQDLAWNSLAKSDRTLMQWSQLIVTTDAALLDRHPGILPTEIISTLDVMAFPITKVGDIFGGRAGIAQPLLILRGSQDR